ncbi:MAG: Ig-like domain-containing protein, partial [Thermoplasmatales archaeon]|nr:Ig-like domain-containing protein [Thermoplasmatales archaeon]
WGQVNPHPQSWRPYNYGVAYSWEIGENLSTIDTEYIVVAEVINGVNGRTGANYTGSTNMSVTALTGDPVNMPNIYLEEIPTPIKNSYDDATGTINITWTGLYENISEAYYPDGVQDWYGYAENIVGYSVFRSKDNEPFIRVGNAIQNRGGPVYFEETSLLPGTYQYRIAVNYRYGVNDGTNIVDENDLMPANAELPDIYVSTGRSPASESVTLSDVTLPEITELQPEQGSLVNTNKPAISAVFVEEGSGINESRIVMTVAGKNILSTNYTYYPSNKTVVYTPTEALSEGMCTVTVNVSDISGNPSSKTWWFTVDTESPEVVEVLPTGSEVRVTEPIVITFNEPINQTSVEDAFSISQDPGGWWWESYDATMMRLTHNYLDTNTTYTCNISTAAKDKAGNHMTEEYSWVFTTIEALGITVNFPNGGEHWTGGRTHKINYTVAGGDSPYDITLYYSTEGVWEPICNLSHGDAGTYTYDWTLLSINSTTVKVKAKATDNLSEVYSDESDMYFQIDSTLPTVNWTIPENNSEVQASQSIIIKFSEEMNTDLPVDTFFSITPDPGGWLWGWNTAGDKLTGTHNPFEIGRTYTCTISTDAKDDSSPGNNLAADYSWSFTSKLGRGDFSVSVSYASQVEVNKELTVTVAVSNTGPDAYNMSGSLNVKIYKSSDNINFFYVDDKDIVPMEANSSDSKTFTLTFDKAGKWYIKVEVSSAGDEDIIEGKQAYTTILPVTVTSIPEEIGIGPYILIAVMVALVAVVGMLTLWGIKKKRKKTG